MISSVFDGRVIWGWGDGVTSVQIRSVTVWVKNGQFVPKLVGGRFKKKKSDQGETF
jgi:hypothetical protein